ncbi:LuxR C-terminal-related transcriptional regulator [Leucobacter sp. L43]|uniref:LuxR C-terminal-related transcriptional regulator n=1 Tax=Leucobacter sp. L43 TaxID=2798040 RepID=UPI001904FCE0
MPGDVVAEARAAVDAHGHVRRDRLLHRIGHSGRVVIIHAEQGAGKTELMSQWLAYHRPSAPAWVALDSGASDPHSLWSRLLQALQAARPETFASLANDYLAGRIRPEEALSLITSATMRDPHPVTLVLDDLHFVAGELQDQLVSLLRRSPNLRLLAASRSRTRFEVPLTAAGLAVTSLSISDLAFTTDEIAALAATLPYQLSTPELAALRRSTRGHPLAVRLALSVMSSLSRDGARRPTPDEVQYGIEGALADFAPQFPAPEDRTLALMAALVPEIDRSFADRLGGANAWANLERLDALGYGRVESRHGRAAFRLHTLIAGALRTRALTELPQERIAEVRRLAFEHLYEHADPIDILELLIDGNMDRAIFPHFVRNYSEINLKRSRELVAVTEGISAERQQREGTIPIMIAVALSEDSLVPTPRMRQLLELGMPTLEHRVAEAGGAAGRLLQLARFAGLRVSRSYEAAAEAGEQFLRQSGLGSPSWRSGMHAARLQVVLTELLAARIPRALALAEGLADDAHPARRTHQHSMLAFAHARMGDLRAAKRELAAVDASRADWWDSPHSIGWHLARALRASSLGRHDEAFEALRSTETHLDESELWPAIVWTRGIARLVADQAALGYQELDGALAAREHLPLSAGWAEELQTLRGEFLLATGDLVGARAALAHPGIGASSRLARARLAILASQPIDALTHLDALERDAHDSSANDSGPFPAQAVQQQLLRAAAYARQGNAECATSLATQAFLALDRLDNRLPLLWIPSGEMAIIRTLVPLDIWRVPPGSPFAGDEVVLEELSKREALVLIELARGGSIDDIAGDLHVSSNTIKTQTRSIYKKLKVSSRTEALARARQMGLV